MQEQQEEAAQAMSTISQESNFTGKKNLNIFKSTEWNYYQDYRTFIRFPTGPISVQGNLTINQLQATSQ